MKKLVLIVAASFAALSLSAQSAGEFRLGGSIGFSTSSVKIGSASSEETQSSFSILPEAEYFVIDNLSVGLGLGYASEKNNVSSTVTTTMGNFVVMPSVSYYFQISDKFSYNPAFFVGFGFGKETTKTQLAGGSTEVSTDANSFQIGLKLVRFDYKIADNFALGFSAGDLGYRSVSAGIGDAKTTLGKFSLGINVAPELSFQYVF